MVQEMVDLVVEEDVVTWEDMVENHLVEEEQAVEVVDLEEVEVTWEDLDMVVVELDMVVVGLDQVTEDLVEEAE